MKQHNSKDLAGTESAECVHAQIFAGDTLIFKVVKKSQAAVEQNIKA